MPSHYYNYLPFGEEGVSQNQSEYNNVYRFSAKELDDETQLSYFGARYYDARLSYWLSVDPLWGKTLRYSPYHYVRNNPLNRFDPDGRTDYKVDGETKTINDGNTDLTVKNVTQRQFERLQRKFENGKTPAYNRLLNKISQKNGYQVARVVTPSWGYSDEYKLEITSYGRNNKTPYSKHAHRDFYKFTEGLQDMGDNMSIAGYGLTLSVVGAEAGIPLAGLGRIFSGIGLGLQTGMDFYTGEYEEVAKNVAIYVGGGFVNRKIGKFASKTFNDDGLSEEILKQNVDVKMIIIDHAIENKIERK